MKRSAKHPIRYAIPSVTVAVAVMTLVAYALGHLTRSDWVWWLAPLTVTLEGARLLRDDLRDRAALLSSSDDSFGAGPDAVACVASYAMAMAMAAWGAYAGHRVAILTGAAVAVVGNALDWGEDPV